MGCFRHDPNRSKDHEIIVLLQRMASSHPSWGFGLMFDNLRYRGYRWNHKRVYRVYCELALNLRIKPKKRIPSRHPKPLAVPESPNVSWSMDFMSDALSDGTAFRTLNIIDDFNREVLHVEIDRSLPAERVIRSLEQAIDQFGKPEKIRIDNGPEFISAALCRWTNLREIELDFIKPGKPTQNAYVERFNKTFRTEVLDMHVFSYLDDVRDFVTRWMWEYNRVRTHKSIGRIPPWAARQNWQAQSIDRTSVPITN